MSVTNQPEPIPTEPDYPMPEWTFHENGDVTIRLPRNFALNLGEDLNHWERWDGWVNREDCQNWKRSPIARENRRESIVYGNCLGTIKGILGRRNVLRLMQMAKEDTDNG